MGCRGGPDSCYSVWEAPGPRGHALGPITQGTRLPQRGKPPAARAQHRGLGKWRRAEGCASGCAGGSWRALPQEPSAGNAETTNAPALGHAASESGKKRARGKGPSTHGSWRRQRLQPASVASPRSGRRCRPRPLRATPPSRLLPPAPSRPDADSHWAEQNTWSAVPRASPGGRRAELGGRSAGRGAELPGSAGSGREKLGRVTWAAGWRGAAGDVALRRCRARDRAK